MSSHSRNNFTSMGSYSWKILLEIEVGGLMVILFLHRTIKEAVIRVSYDNGKGGRISYFTVATLIFTGVVMI